MNEFEREFYLKKLRELEKDFNSHVKRVSSLKKELRKAQMENILRIHRASERHCLADVEGDGKEFDKSSLKATKTEGEEVASVLSKAVKKGLINRFKNYMEKN